VSSASEILERDSELVRIAAALDSATKGSGRVIVIEGEAGIGKTALMRETRELAQQRGFGRLQATGDETETAMAWGVVRQMVERSVSRYSGAVRSAILDGPAGAALQALDVAPDSNAADAEIARTLHALWWVAIDLSSTRPLLITVDDAQWADQPSLRFLGYLARRIADLPIALVVATRPPSGGSGPLTELTVSPQVERLLPDPLSPVAVAAFHTPDGVVPCPEVVEAMHAACGGNPFLTGALLDELSSAGHNVGLPSTAQAIGGLGPATISRAMLSRLSPDALALAGAAAVLGLEASTWLAARVAPVSADALPHAVESLVRANVLIGGVDGLTFVHPVIREATVAALGPLQTSAMHARAVLELHARQAPARQLAPHLLAAPVGTLPDAAELLARAASESSAAGDRSVAAACLERALVERPGDAALRARLGHTLLRAGRPQEAREHLRASVAMVGSDGDARQRAELQSAVAQATLAVDGAEVAVDELVEALAAWPPVEQEPARLLLEARLGVTRSFVAAQRRVAGEHLQQFAHLAGDTPQERTLLALLAQRGRYEGAPHLEIADLARRALSEGALFDDAARGDGLVGWVLAMMSLITADALPEARTEIDRALARVVRGGSPLDFAMVANCAMVAAWRTGDVAATEAEAEAVIAAIQHEPEGPEVLSLRATAAHMGGYTALERRDLPATRAWIDDFDAQARELRVIPMLWLHELRSRISLAADDPHGALQHLETLQREAREADVDPAALAWRLPAAVAYSRLGDDEKARATLDDHLALARRSGAPGDLGAAMRVAARFEPDAAVREGLLAEATVVLERSPDRLEQAKSLVDLAETQRALGRRTESRELLTRAADLALACGATALQTRIAGALQALGDRPRRLIAPGPESLTASERRVASLAVSGRSNRDIAHELFVSPKTVENHLGRVYTKLGIANRRELAGALG
jgi:DNA-binding CsgD family transcriptional regulator